MTISRMNAAFLRFDEYNRKDPNNLHFNGEIFPGEYFYSTKLSEWVMKLSSDPSESLLLASRAQHIGRWELSRESYASGKAGYLKWRSDLAKFHAEKAGEILSEVGYSEHEIQDVQRIILKQKLKTDEDVQTMENALCLVFLEYQFEDFISKHDDEKLVRIVQKTWKKMSDPGREHALKLHFSAKATEIIRAALA